MVTGVDVYNKSLLFDLITEGALTYKGNLAYL